MSGSTTRWVPIDRLNAGDRIVYRNICGGMVDASPVLAALDERDMHVDIWLCGERNEMFFRSTSERVEILA